MITLKTTHTINQDTIHCANGFYIGIVSFQDVKQNKKRTKLFGFFFKLFKKEAKCAKHENDKRETFVSYMVHVIIFLKYSSCHHFLCKICKLMLVVISVLN